MNSYLLKNLLFFSLALLVSILVVGLGQFLLTDREFIRTETERIAALNRAFQNDLPSVMRRKFILIDFLANTSYPETALSFSMEEQFARLIDKFSAMGKPPDVLLFDTAGRLRAHSGVSAEFLANIRAARTFLSRESEFYGLEESILYIRPFSAAEKNRTAGYLGGVLSRDEIRDTIKWSYLERTFMHSRFAPSVSVWFTGGEKGISPLKFQAEFSLNEPSQGVLPFNSQTLLLLAALALVSLAVFSIFIRNSLRKPLQELLVIVGTVPHRDDKLDDVKLPSDSLFRKIASAIIEMHRQRLGLEKEMRERELALRLARVAARVAHDIRSPLAALNVAASDLTGVSEKSRRLLSSAVERINEISTDLLVRHEPALRIAEGATHSELLGKDSSESRTATDLRSELLTLLVDDVIAEKRLQYRALQRVAIRFAPSRAAHSAFASVSAGDFKRVLSNIINNAVESIAAAGSVSVEVNLSDNLPAQVVVTVKDDGCGIPAELLPRILGEGYSYGKPGGHGIGLPQARRAVEGWGGALAIHSEVGRGTAVEIHLPSCPPPHWFPECLQLTSDTLIIILDDDPSIHEAWNRRIEASESGRGGFQAIHFFDPRALRIWWRENSPQQRPLVALVDYEFAGWDGTGIEIITELRPAANAILVSSYSRERSVQEKCIALGIQLLPKELIGSVPFAVKDRDSSCNRVDAILVDDDRLIRLSWTVAAEQERIILKTFKTGKELLAIAATLDRATPIYVDCLLEGESGIDLTAQLGEMGFTELHLATGRLPDRLQPMPWLKSVCGKCPPWVPVKVPGL